MNSNKRLVNQTMKFDWGRDCGLPMTNERSVFVELSSVREVLSHTCAQVHVCICGDHMEPPIEVLACLGKLARACL